MSTSALTCASLHQQMETYFHTRQKDLAQLGKDLQSGNMSAAQQDYNSIVSLGQSGPFQNGDPFYVAQRETDFNNIGQALQSGNLSAAQQAFSALRETFLIPETSSKVSPGSESNSTPPGSVSVSA
jgi:outer membrane protein assembly factor BamD (BamD/ComL family)